MPSPIAPLSVLDRQPVRASTTAVAPGFDAALAASDEKARAPSLVAAVRTRLEPAQAREALAKAWTQVTGEAPNEKTLSLVTAQWAHETGNGASMYNYNFAGIKGAGPGGLSVAQHTREGFGASERRIIDNFRAYRSADEGATDYVKLLTRRFPEAVEGAKQGDPASFVRGLKSRGYFTGHEGSYLSSVTRLASQISGSEFDVSSAPPALDYARSGPGAPLELRGLYDQMASSGADAYVDALSITDELDRAALRIAFGSARKEQG